MDLLWPAKLALRALDDLHTLARAADGRADELDRVERGIERLEAAADRVVGAATMVHEGGKKLDADLLRTEASVEVIAEAAEPLQGAAERVGRWVKPKR
jgi:hypothetical protein